MHYLLDYINYFTALCANHKQLAYNADTRKGLVIVEQSTDPFKKWDLSPWAGSLRNNFPEIGMVLVTPDAEYNQNSSEHKQKKVQGMFFIMAKAQKSGSTNSQNTARFTTWDNTERVAEEIIAYMKKDFDNNIELRYFDLGDFENAKITDGDFVGTRISFTITSRPKNILAYDAAKWLTPLP